MEQAVNRQLDRESHEEFLERVESTLFSFLVKEIKSTIESMVGKFPLIFERFLIKRTTLQVFCSCIELYINLMHNKSRTLLTRNARSRKEENSLIKSQNILSV